MSERPLIDITTLRALASESGSLGIYASASGTARTRRYRQRQRAGLTVYSLSLDANDVALQLILSGILTEAETYDKTAMVKGLEIAFKRWGKAQKIL